MMVALGCGEDPAGGKASSGRGDNAASAHDTGGGAPGDDTGEDQGDDTGDASGPDPFADAVVSFEPGDNAGFGADGYPDIVLGPPRGAGNAGSLDVLSLGNEGVIVLELVDFTLVDGPGPDLLVFENPFVGWAETGVVAVSEDGETWHEWPCDAADADGGFPGCAGYGLVYAHPDNDIDPTDPETAGGDAFDLADLGVTAARFVRIRDSGANAYEGNSGGFDLDAIAVVNGAEP